MFVWFDVDICNANHFLWSCFSFIKVLFPFKSLRTFGDFVKQDGYLHLFYIQIHEYHEHSNSLWKTYAEYVIGFLIWLSSACLPKAPVNNKLRAFGPLKNPKKINYPNKESVRKLLLIQTRSHLFLAKSHLEEVTLISSNKS